LTVILFNVTDSLHVVCVIDELRLNNKL